MARAIGLMLVLAATACTDGDAPPQLVGADFSAAVPGDGGSNACMTACDCPAGEACQMGSCKLLQTKIYCCGTAACTGSAVCESPDGTVSQCDRPDGGVTPVVDGGVPTAACEMTSCTRGGGGDLFCVLACGSKTATCVRTGGIDHCTP